MDNSYLCSTEQALEHFQVDEQEGLSEQQVRRSLDKYGRNGTVHHHISDPKTVLILPPQHYQKILQRLCGNLSLNNSKIS